MKKSVLIALAKLIKHYDKSHADYYVGARDGLITFLESSGYVCLYQGSLLVIQDRSGSEVVRV